MALTQVTKEFITNIDPNQINSGGATTKDVLNWDGSKWAPNSLASINNGNFILNPGATTGQVLTFNGTSWVGGNGVSSSDFTGSNQSLATNGYQKLPGGLILQWGSSLFGNVGLGGFTDVVVTFPISFNTNCFKVIISLETGSTTQNQAAFGSVYANPSLTNFTARIEEWFGGTVQDLTLTYFAIGN